MDEEDGTYLLHDAGTTPQTTTASKTRRAQFLVFACFVISLFLNRSLDFFSLMGIRIDSTVDRQSTHHNDAPIEKVTSSRPLNMDNIKERHSQCFSPSLTRPEKGRQAISVGEVGRYVPVDKTVDEPPRYDHLSCFVMKARYNCATNFPSEEGKQAADWKLVLASENNTDTVCNPRVLVDDVGGPVGVAKKMRQRIRTSVDNDKSMTAKKRPINIVMHGNSYLRQMWEALTCNWSDQISKIVLQQGGPGFSLASLKKRGTNKIQTAEMGVLLRDPPHELGCHGAENLTRFYESDVTVPSSIPQCNDNVAMVEFGGKMRIHYVFRPSLYENMTDVYAKLDLRVDEIDALIFNDGENKEYPDYLRKQLRKGIFQQAQKWALYPFRKLQFRDANQWFGAINPFITDPPDGHPCMPGVPDDEVNLMLYLLFLNYGIQP